MQRQIFSTMERLVGVLLETGWNGLDRDLKKNILTFLRGDDEAVLKMSCVNQQSREELTESRQTIIHRREIEKWLCEPETGDSLSFMF